MPLIQISVIEGRDPETRRRLLREVSHAAAAALGADPGTVRVILTEVPAEHWAVGGVSKAETAEVRR